LFQTTRGAWWERAATLYNASNIFIKVVLQSIALGGTIFIAYRATKKARSKTEHFLFVAPKG